VAVGYPHCTLCISEIRGRVKAWFDAQGRVQTYRGLVYIGVTRVVSTFTYIGILHIFFTLLPIYMYLYVDYCN